MAVSTVVQAGLDDAGVSSARSGMSSRLLGLDWHVTSWRGAVLITPPLQVAFTAFQQYMAAAKLTAEMRQYLHCDDKTGAAGEKIQKISRLWPLKGRPNTSVLRRRRKAARQQDEEVRQFSTPPEEEGIYLFEVPTRRVLKQMYLSNPLRDLNQHPRQQDEHASGPLCTVTSRGWGVSPYS